MVLGKLGGPIRPKSFRDDDEDAKRGKMWLGGMAALLVILGLIFGYHSDNQSYKQKRVLNPTPTKAKDLFAREDSEDGNAIASLECKCASKLVEYAPPLQDLDGDSCPGGEVEGDTVFTTRIYARCVESFALGAAASGANVGTVSPRTCAAPEATTNFFENMCVTFVSSLQNDWEMRKEKISSLKTSEFYADVILEDYYDVCIVALGRQTGFVDMLHASLRHFDISQDSQDQFQDDVRVPFVNTLAEYDEKICLYPDEGSLYAELYELELMGLEAAYERHFEDCNPSACTFEELETALDVMLKTVALASPLMALIMSIAAFAYNSTDNKHKWRVGPAPAQDNSGEHTDGSGEMTALPRAN